MSRGLDCLTDLIGHASLKRAFDQMPGCDSDSPLELGEVLRRPPSTARSPMPAFRRHGLTVIGFGLAVVPVLQDSVKLHGP